MNPFEFMKFMNYYGIMNTAQSRPQSLVVGVASDGSDTNATASPREQKRLLGKFRMRRENHLDGMRTSVAVNRRGLRLVILRLQRALSRNTGDLVIVRRSDLSELVKSQIESELTLLLQEYRNGSDAIAAARARGADYKVAELAKPENLSIAKAAQRVGNSEKWINTLRQRGELYALVQDGQTRKFRYPQWQFDADRLRLAQVLGALSKANVGCWGIHSFMGMPSADIEGLTPQEWILHRDKPLDTVLQAVERRFADDQGA